MEKPALKKFAIFTESCKPATLLKTDSDAVVFLWLLRNFSGHLFKITSARWADSSVLTLLLSSDNLLTGYEQLAYLQSIEIYQFVFH